VFQPNERTHPDAFRLSKLIYCMGLIILIGYYASSVVISYLLAGNTVASLVPALAYSHLVLFGFPLVSGIIACVLYRPLRVVFSPVRPNPDQSPGWLSLLYGLGGGLVGFIVSIPFLWAGDAGGDVVAEAISHANSVKGLAMLLLLIVVLPVVMEMTFRGLVFKTLVIHADVPSAIVASSLLFALIWPTFSRPVGIFFGILSALLYIRTNGLLAPILANAVLSFSGGAFILSRALGRH